MYLYYDRAGNLKEIINDIPARQGAVNVNKIYVYWEGYENNDDIIVTSQFVLPNNEVLVEKNSTQIIADKNNPESIIPYNEEQDLKFFKYFTPYRFYRINIPTEALSVSGSVLLTVYVYENVHQNDDDRFVLSSIPFYVSKTTTEEAELDYLSIAQYYYLRQLLNGKLDANTKQVIVDSLPAKGEVNTIYYLKGSLTEDPYLIYIWNGVAWNKLGELSGDFASKEEQKEFENQILADISQIRNEVTNPFEVVNTVSQLPSTNQNKLYVVKENNHWYYWNGSEYTDGGAFMDSGITIENLENSYSELGQALYQYIETRYNGGDHRPFMMIVESVANWQGNEYQDQPLGNAIGWYDELSGEIVIIVNTGVFVLDTDFSTRPKIEDIVLSVDVNYDNSNSGLSANNVQGAIDEIIKNNVFAKMNDISISFLSVDNTTNTVISGINFIAGETYTLYIRDIETSGGFKNCSFGIKIYDVNWNIMLNQFLDYNTKYLKGIKTDTFVFPEGAKYIYLASYASGTNGVETKVIYKDIYFLKGEATSPSSYLNNKISVKNQIDNALIGYEKTIDFTKYGLPVLYLEGDTSTMTKDNEVTLNYVYGDRKGTLTCKWQGTSSLQWDKKNYTIKFDNAFEAQTGWGVQKKYCLKADYIEFSHTRNVGSAKLWGKMIKTRPNAPARLTSLVNGGAIDGFPICLSINGKYVGLYNFNIPKDAWMMGMDGSTKQAIICAEGGDVEVQNYIKFIEPPQVNGKDYDEEYRSDNWTKEEMVASLGVLQSALKQNYATTQEFETAVSPYLDIDSIIDYMIHAQMIGNTDGYFKNYLLSTFDGVKWFITVYDMDACFGLNWNGLNAHASGNQFMKADTSLSVLNLLFSQVYRYEKGKIKQRYTQLTTYYDGILSDAKVWDTMMSYAGKFPKALLDEEVRIWSGIGMTSVNNGNMIMTYYTMNKIYWDKFFENL